MAVLIDGYNLLHVTGIIGRGVGPGTLERTRCALLNFIATSLGPDELARVTVVFDAHDPPPGLPSVVVHKGIMVRYAVGHENADALIEELIRKDSAPRSLVVVSSDHRVQRAARRRRANPIDSDVWYEQLFQRRGSKHADADCPSDDKPNTPLSAHEVQHWLDEFGPVEETQNDDLALRDAIKSEGQRKPSALKSDVPACDDMANPFPPGYAEDLLTGEP